MATAPSASTPFNPGHAFKEGKLYTFHSESAEVFRAWPPQAWQKSGADPWRGWVPRYFSLRAMERCVKEVRARTNDPNSRNRPTTYKRIQADCYATYLSHVPDEIKALIRPFLSPDWNLLCLPARCPDAEDLMRSNPALAAALAWNRALRPRRVQRPWRSVRSLIGKKRRLIAGWLGFPDTNSAVRILGKIPENAVSLILLRYLRTGLLEQSDLSDRLAHLPKINRTVVRIATDRDYARWVTPTFLKEVSALRAPRDQREIAYLFRDLKGMVEFVGASEAESLVRSPMANLRSLRTRHDELVGAMNGQLQHIRHRLLGVDSAHDLDPKQPFPPAPVPGTPEIVPITDLEELWTEGMTQHHCVGSYGPRILAGDFFVYRILGSERATLSIRRHHPEWRIDQLKRARNRAPSDALRARIQGWLDTQQNSLSPFDRLP